MRRRGPPPRPRRLPPSPADAPPVCPSSFTAADLKKLSDGNYAFALWATVNGLQSVMAMSTFFTLASGAPELPTTKLSPPPPRRQARARGGGGGGGGGGRQRRRVWRRGLLGAALAVLDAATAHDSDRGGSDTAGEDDDEPRARSPPPEYDAYDEPPRGRRGGRRAPREAREAQLSDGEFESVAVAVMKTLSARGGLASRELLDVASDALPAEAAPEPFVALVEVLRLLVRTRFVIRDRNDPSEPPLVRLACPLCRRPPPLHRSPSPAPPQYSLSNSAEGYFLHFDVSAEHAPAPVVEISPGKNIISDTKLDDFDADGGDDASPPKRAGNGGAPEVKRQDSAPSAPGRYRIKKRKADVADDEPPPAAAPAPAAAAAAPSQPPAQQQQQPPAQQQPAGQLQNQPYQPPPPQPKPAGNALAILSAQLGVGGPAAGAAACNAVARRPLCSSSKWLPRAVALAAAAVAVAAAAAARRRTASPRWVRARWVRARWGRARWDIAAAGTTAAAAATAGARAAAPEEPWAAEGTAAAAAAAAAR